MGRRRIREPFLTIRSFCSRSKLGRNKRLNKRSIEETHPTGNTVSFLETVAQIANTIRRKLWKPDAHENQHAKDEHTLSGFFTLFTKGGRRELETRAFKAELAVENRNIKKLESVGPRTGMQDKTLVILKNMRDQATSAIEFPQVYTP